MKQFGNVRKAFSALRKAGYFAKMNFMCCQSCGWAAVPSEKAEKAVFFHAQDNARRKTGKSFCLSWSGDGKEIVSILKAAGLKIQWQGSSHQRILVAQEERNDK